MNIQNKANGFRHALLLGGLLGSTLLLSACIEFTTECEVDPAACSGDDSSQQDSASDTVTHTPTTGIPQLTASPTFSHNPVGLGGWTTLNIPVDEDTQGVAIHFAKLDAADMTDYHSTGGPLDSYYKDKTTGSTNVSLEIVANYAHSEHYYMVVSLCSMPWTYVADGQSYNCDNGNLVRYSNALVGSNPIQQSTSNYYFQEQLASGNIGVTDFNLAKLVIDDTSNVSNRNNATFKISFPDNASQINSAKAIVFDPNGNFVASTLSVNGAAYAPVYDMAGFDPLTETAEGLIAHASLTPGDYNYWWEGSYLAPVSNIDSTPTEHLVSARGSFSVTTGATLITVAATALGEKLEVAREVLTSTMSDASAVPTGNSYYCLWSLPGTKPFTDVEAAMGKSTVWGGSNISNAFLANGTYDLSCYIDVDDSMDYQGGNTTYTHVFEGLSSGDALAVIENVVVDHSGTAADATTTVSNDYVWTLQP